MRANIEEIGFIKCSLKKNCQFLKRNISLQALFKKIHSLPKGFFKDENNGEVVPKL